MGRIWRRWNDWIKENLEAMGQREEAADQQSWRRKNWVHAVRPTWCERSPNKKKQVLLYIRIERWSIESF